MSEIAAINRAGLKRARMASPAVNAVTNLASGLASAIYMFAGLMLVSGIVASSRPASGDERNARAK